MSIDQYDSVYLSQTWCNHDDIHMKSGSIYINKFNWECPVGTTMDWDDLICHPDRIFCRCGFEIQNVTGIGIQCYKYVGHTFDEQRLEIEEMISMDWPRLNYWASVCVRAMNYKIGEKSELDWYELLDKIENKSYTLRHESDVYSVVDGRYKARTRGSPPTFTHIYQDIHSFKDDLQPINGTLIFGDGDLVLSFSWAFLSLDFMMVYYHFCMILDGIH